MCTDASVVCTDASVVYTDASVVCTEVWCVLMLVLICFSLASLRMLIILKTYTNITYLRQEVELLLLSSKDLHYNAGPNPAQVVTRVCVLCLE